MKRKAEISMYNDMWLDVLTVLLFLPPLLRGLFFEFDWLLYETAVGFTVFVYILIKSGLTPKALRGEGHLSLIDLSAGAILICYFISLFVALDLN